MTTQAQVLAVAWDHASDTAEYSVSLRQAIANALSSLRIAGPWQQGRREDWVRQALPGDPRDFIASVDILDDEQWGWAVYEPGYDPAGRTLRQERARTRAEAFALADAALLEAGWVLCPQPSAQP